jgi:hypothetical protein
MWKDLSSKGKKGHSGRQGWTPVSHLQRFVNWTETGFGKQKPFGALQKCCMVRMEFSNGSIVDNREDVQR